ncbi:MAG: potassium transporter [Deltaproteobacteria bacterium HGW-Deltaproteobacteria-19]|jgi:trk system potassium uptake protein TrkH|nr:MAG: potassium transporter [Deltaproteobacteria bacterium HGW-Deltaproteobacteria-19]
MNGRLIAHLLSVLVLVLGFSMLLPVLVSVWYGEVCVRSLLLAAVLTGGLGLAMRAASGRPADRYLSHRDGVAIVTGGWMLAGLVATLPYLLTGVIPDFTDAYFECVSGFTTTGSSIFGTVEGLPKGVLFWRSLTQWFGGMGIIVLSIAILPFLGIGGMQLYKAETPSPVVDKLTPRISDTAKVLWKVYVLLTLVQIILLLFGGMSLFDAVCHAFTTMPTGGFSTKNASIAAYDSLYIEIVVTVFMILAGMNFALHYRLLRGDFRSVRKDPEIRVYLLIFGVLTFLVAANLYGRTYPSAPEALRYASFQVASILTTTGFATADFEQWPAFSQIVLLLCMFLGSMAGSTGGGIKTLRLLLLAKHAYLEVVRVIHPHAMTIVKLGPTPVSQSVLRSVWGFFILFMGIYVLATLIMSALGVDFMTAVSSVATCLGNVGPGLGAVGPTEHYGGLPVAGKWVLIACMLLGRLEIYTVLVFLMPRFWKD